MNASSTARVGVVLAASILVVLSSGLAVQLLPRDGGAAVAATRPPAGAVPAPRPADLVSLEIPCWSCPGAQDWPLRFRTDLDLLAPLGTGPANAAEWFGAFRKPDGPRLAEAVAADDRRVADPAVGMVLPPGDPLLREAEPWCDQATMRFYPDVLALSGPNTQLPNLLMALTLARSWVARGRQAASLDEAYADFARTIRLGRLLRQEDTVIVNDLVGLACIRIGAEAIHARALREGKLELALVAAIVAGEATPQKLLTAARVTSVELGPYLRPASGGGHTIELPEKRLEAIVAMATASPDRRFRGEAMWDLQVVAALGSGAQAATARKTLETLARSTDAVVAAGARAFLAHRVTPDDVAVLLEPVMK